MNFPIWMWFHSALTQLDSYLERRPWGLLTLILIGYGFFGIRLAQYRPLWLDEVATFIIASRPEVPLLEMLRNGMDLMPPLYHYIARMSVSLFGASDLAIRIPSIAGLLCFSLCFFCLLRRWCGSVWALIGLVCALQGVFLTYLTEARSYALVLAFLALASLAWQRSAGRGRMWWIAVMSLAMGAAIAGHYYAVLGLFPLGLGQLARDYSRRRFDLLLWSGILVPLTVLGAHMPLLQAIMAVYQGVAPGTYEAANFRYVDTVRLMTGGLYLIPAVLLLQWFSGDDKEDATAMRAANVEALCLLGGTAAILFAGKAVSVLAGTNLYPRYLLFSAAGFTGLAVLLAAWRRPPSPAVRMLVLLLVTLSLARSMRNEYNSSSATRNSFAWVRQNVSPANGPVLLGNLFSFMTMYHYRAAAGLPLIEFPYFDETERQSLPDAPTYGLLAVQRRYVPDLPLRNWNELLRQGGQFQILQWRDTAPWALRESIRLGAAPQLIAYSEDWSLFTVRTPRPKAP